MCDFCRLQDCEAAQPSPIRLSDALSAREVEQGGTSKPMELWEAPRFRRLSEESLGRRESPVWLPEQRVINR